MFIKQSPEDFVVEEVSSRSFAASGSIWAYRITKRDMNTQDAVKLLARHNRCSFKSIRYAGLKDKRAVTSQFISSECQLEAAGSVELEHVGFLDDHLHLGDLEVNRFRILARDVKEVRDVVIPNYFGDQRFSSDNVRVGMLLLKSQWAEAAKYFSTQSRKAAAYFEQHPTDPIGALRCVDFRLLLLYVHAAQSYFFNEALVSYIQDCCSSCVESEYRHGKLLFPEQLDDRAVPLIGAVSDLGDWKQYYQPLLDKHGLSQRDFVVRSIPGLTLEGSTRSLLADVREKSIALDDSVATVEMSLGPGCYATVCLAGWLA